MSAPAMIDRRGFLKASAAAGGGLLVAFYVPGLDLGLPAQAPKPQPLLPFAYVKIAPDETVTIVANHSEMGQGVYTSLPMLLNEELQADWSRIRVESAPVDAAYNHPVFGMQMTGGSTTTAAEWDHYRKIGAAARIVLIGAAAQQWKVDASTCRAENGVVIHGPTSKNASYGSLVKVAATLPVPNDVPLKDPKNFTLIGKPTRRLDTPSKTRWCNVR